MKKLLTICITLLLLATFAVAKGGTSGGTITKRAEIAPDEPSAPDCEKFNEARNRIKCRLEFGASEVSVPEPCRAIENNQWCIDYYVKVLPCYEINGVAKDKCFKDLAWFKKKSVKEQAKLDNTKPIRNYMLFVLYDMEEMVEDAQTAGTIDLDTAATLIDDIVKIKIQVINKGAKTEIKQALASLKANWPTTIQ
tara:strand:- start:1331 stop:1915 length:585 start_codon:yes stop_codon:yes gene_type:complete